MLLTSIVQKKLPKDGMKSFTSCPVKVTSKDLVKRDRDLLETEVYIALLTLNLILFTQVLT